jgi:hypothetical protein
MKNNTTLDEIDAIKGITYLKNIRKKSKKNEEEKENEIQIKLNVPTFSLHNMKNDYYENYNITHLKKIKEKILTLNSVDSFKKINRLDFPINIKTRKKLDPNLHSMLILFYKHIKSNNSNQKINISKYINFETIEDTGITLNSSTFEITYYDKEKESNGHSPFKDRLEFKYLKRKRNEDNKNIVKNERKLLLELINTLNQMKDKKAFKLIETSIIETLIHYYDKHQYINFTTFLHKVKPLVLTRNIYKNLYYNKMSGKSWSDNKSDYNKKRIEEDKIYVITYNNFKNYIDETISKINQYLNY